MQFAVIAKEPVPGRVKTRLCPPFTPEEAALLATAALRDTLAAVGATPASRHVLVLDGQSGSWLPPGFVVMAQRGRDLGARLGAAFADCAGSRDEPTVLVGMDTPQLTTRQLLEAADMLTRAKHGRRRAVIGPALDGGFWLIGLSRADTRVFRGVTMSSSRTFDEQAQQLRRCGFEVQVTDVMRDVDSAGDAAAVAAASSGTNFARQYGALLPASLSSASGPR
jgi:rSAM/selenodomain-associated transferase 1